MPSVTVPLGTRVLLFVPAVAVLYASVKFAVSPGAMVPVVTAGVAAAVVLLSYVLLFVVAVTVMARLSMLPVVVAVVEESW